MKRAGLFVGFLLVCLATAPSVWAQGVSTSQIAGVVRDSSGGVLPGVAVTALKTDTALSRTVVTGSDGSYTIPNLPVGPYKLTVVLDGFNTYVRDGIVLQVQSNPTIDVVLTVGGVAEQVNVVANSSMVETKSTAVGQVIDNKQVIEMPLNGRQATELIYLSGLATTAAVGDLQTNKNYPTVTISVAGGQANGMTYIMDGGTYNDPFNNLNLPTPNPDALQEFKVETSALSARYGHHAASAVNIVTKSGTNSFHGNAFEFMRDHRLNAIKAFTKVDDGLKRNQFGGTVGGPIKKDKVFFFGSYQGTNLKTTPTDNTAFVPTQAMLNGDFTQIASKDCNATGAKTLAAPFVNNQINPALFSKAAMNVLKLVPVATDPCGKYQYGVKSDSTDNQMLSKVDYTLNQNHTLTARYVYSKYDKPILYDGKNILMIAGAGVGQKNQVHAFVAGHNWIVSPRAVNALHVTYNRTINARVVPEFFGPGDIGVKADTDTRLPGFMGIAVANGFAIAQGGNNPGYFNSWATQIADDFDYIVGKHQFSVGGSVIKTRIETANNRPTNGQFTFGTSFTGLGLSDFMLGDLATLLQGNMSVDWDNHLYYGVYAMDDWKPTSNLTINYGLRWEPFNPIKSTTNQFNHFSQEWFDQNRRSTVYPLAPAGLMFPGDQGYPSGGAVTHAARSNQFAPRVGMIWSPLKDNSMSVRAAWGIFYDTPHLFFDTRFASNAPWGSNVLITYPVGGTPAFDDPWLNQPGGNPFPALRSNFTAQEFGRGVAYVSNPLDLHNTQIQQWNVSVQKGFGDLLFAATYLGNKGAHVWRAIEADPAVPIAGATLGNTTARRKLTLSNPTWGPYYASIAVTDDNGRSRYDALLLSAQKRMSKSWSVLTNYTLSKCMTDPATTELTGPTITDPNNPGGDYGYCGSDRRHVWNFSAVYAVPHVADGFLGAVVNDWQIAPILRWQSGVRISITTGVDSGLTGMPNQRAVQVSDDVYASNPTYTNASTNVKYLNPAAFTAPASGTYSTLAPYTVVGPSSLGDDVSISRSFRLGGGRALQFRWEIFNVINHINMLPAGLGINATGTTWALNSPTFGQITSAGEPRIMQLALKFSF